MALNAYFEKREIQLARFNAADFAAKLTPTDADLEQFYKANEKLFQAPEQASIEYVVLDLDTVKKESDRQPEADLKTYYDQNIQRLSGTEERRASHILIASPKTAPAADREKAKAKAQELLALVKKSPDTFADVARKNSQDPGSAPNGGDLDFFARGSMVKPFEDAAFAMKKGDISDVVESEFGYHVIKLTDIKAPKQRSFEEMKPELEAELKKQQAQKKFAETADAFTNGVYEQSDSLKPVADRLKLEIKSAAKVTRQPGGRRYRRAGKPEIPRRTVCARCDREKTQYGSHRSGAQPARLWPDRAVHAGAYPAFCRSERSGAPALAGPARRGRSPQGRYRQAGRLEGRAGLGHRPFPPVVVSREQTQKLPVP
jgi:peptidyl-prolyl cis-trans isomerase D